MQDSTEEIAQVCATIDYNLLLMIRSSIRIHNTNFSLGIDFAAMMRTNTSTTDMHSICFNKTHALHWGYTESRNPMGGASSHTRS